MTRRSTDYNANRCLYQKIGYEILLPDVLRLPWSISLAVELSTAIRGGLSSNTRNFMMPVGIPSKTLIE